METLATLICLIMVLVLWIIVRENKKTAHEYTYETNKDTCEYYTDKIKTLEIQIWQLQNPPKYEIKKEYQILHPCSGKKMKALCIQVDFIPKENYSPSHYDYKFLNQKTREIIYM